jgi:membrane-associated phospholipid phosphatase
MTLPNRGHRGVTRARRLALVLCVARAAGAQPAVLKADHGPFLRRTDAVFLGSALATAALTSLLDGHLAGEVMEPGHDGSSLHRFSLIGNTIGGPGPLALSAALFAGGRLAHHAELADLGRWGIQAVAVSGITTGVLKGIVGRQRPYAAAGDIDVYRLGHGFGNKEYTSFPSGHTSAAFAVATVLARGTAGDSRFTHRVVTVLAYGAATAVGLSRMYENQHWSSDVVAGAAIGVTSGLAVVRRGRNSPGYAPGLSVESVLRRTSIVPAPHRGFMLAVQAR